MIKEKIIKEQQRQLGISRYGFISMADLFTLGENGELEDLAKENNLTIHFHDGESLPLDVEKFKELNIDDLVYLCQIVDVIGVVER